MEHDLPVPNAERILDAIYAAIRDAINDDLAFLAHPGMTQLWIVFQIAEESLVPEQRSFGWKSQPHAEMLKATEPRIDDEVLEFRRAALEECLRANRDGLLHDLRPDSTAVHIEYVELEGEDESVTDSWGIRIKLKGNQGTQRWTPGPNRLYQLDLNL